MCQNWDMNHILLHSKIYAILPHMVLGTDREKIINLWIKNQGNSEHLN